MSHRQLRIKERTLADRDPRNRSRLEFNNRTWRTLGRGTVALRRVANKRKNARNWKRKKETRVGNRNRRGAYVDDSKTLSLTETCGNRGCKGKEERYRRREEEKERETEKRNSGEDSHTLITRMLYACWWDAYVRARVSKSRVTCVRARGVRILPRERRFRHRDFSVPWAPATPLSRPV